MIRPSTQQSLQNTQEGLYNIYTIEYENIAVAVIKTIIARHEKYIISKKLEDFGGHRSSEDDHSY